MNPAELQRKAIELRNQGFSWDAVAKRLNCSVNDAKRLLVDQVMPRSTYTPKKMPKQSTTRQCVECGFEIEYPWKMCLECGRKHRDKLING